MTARAIFSILVAVAMLFAPLAMGPGAAVAGAPSDHHAQSAKPGHCGGADRDHGDKGKAPKSCCAAMCAGAALAPAASIEPRLFGQSRPAVAPQDFRFTYFDELPTPPPRVA